MLNLKNSSTDRLFGTILRLGSIEECYRFFEDLCTVKEIQDMSQRLEVAMLLKEGKSYLEISSATGVSTATISRVNKCLSYGTGGYDMAINKMPSSED
ncbi:MAG: helix-turn-helix domain-containing protein [Clostridia bacterium]|nr:helix-turn-helix domain-containing protein [Clostridia bacterium]